MKAVSAGLFALLLLSLVVFGCGPKAGEMLVLEVGTHKINLNEYESFFSRNSGSYEIGQNSTLEERERFLTLLTNYKLKLQDAYDRNLLNDPEIIEELQTYRSSLAASYILEREVTEPGVRQMYDRRKDEIRAQHILLMVKPDAKPEDTLKAFETALDLIRKAKAGERFDSLATKHSEDRSVGTNHGDLYFFTGGQMLKEFEEAAYKMKKGEITSIPVRTSFGYHIIKITERQPSRGTVKVAHIMARFLGPGASTGAVDSSDSASAYKRALGFQDSLKKGWSFAKLAAKVSEDAGTAPKGGELGWFERRKLIQPFDEAAFKLKAGEISGLVRTPYGYHILHCDSIRPFPPYEEIRTELKKTYEQSRYNEDYAEFLQKLKIKYNFMFDETLFQSFVASFDSLLTIGDSGWSETVPLDIRTDTLMLVNGKAVSVDSILSIFLNKEEYNNTLLKEADLRKSINRLKEKFLIDEYSFGLEGRSPEFKSLMKEYEDGVVLYKAEQTEVWNKVAVTDTLLKDFYAENKSLFMFPERVDISQIQFFEDTTAAMVYDSLINGANFEKLADRYNEMDPELKDKQGARGILPTENDDLTMLAAKLQAGEISAPVSLETGGFAIVRLNKLIPQEQKTYEEAGAEISNVFQEHESKRLEREWISRLKAKYPVVEHKEVLKKAFSEPSASR